MEVCSSLQKTIVTYHRMDNYLVLPCKANAPTGQDCFIFTSVPCSNSTEECMFSVINKKTDFRANLEILLDSIMVIKMNSPEVVIKWDFQRNCWKIVGRHAGSITKNMEVTKII